MVTFPDSNQFHDQAQQPKVKYSSGQLDTHSWQTECKTAPQAKVQSYEYKKKIRCASRLYVKFDCPLARQKFSLLITVYDCETDL